MPSCVEIKSSLTGEIKTYLCELLHYEPGFGILRYIIDREYNISGVKLTPGDETIALYWEDRPYTLYLWPGNARRETAYYFNIADRISLAPQEFVWRDLAVDILVDHRGAQVLDEHELPAGLEASLARVIETATSLLLRNRDAIIAEAGAAVQRYAAPGK